jgi:hypothetical protein
MVAFLGHSRPKASILLCRPLLYLSKNRAKGVRPESEGGCLHSDRHMLGFLVSLGEPIWDQILLSKYVGRCKDLKKGKRAEAGAVFRLRGQYWPAGYPDLGCRIWALRWMGVV